MPNEPDLPEDSAEFRSAMKRIVWPWAVPGLIIALAGVAILALTAFESAIGAALLGFGFGLEVYGLIRGRRFRRSFIHSHPL